MYKVPQHIDKNKIFIVQRSEIEGRLDPKMALYNRKAQSSIYPKVRLKDLIVCKPQYGAGEPGIERKNVSDARYIRITDIDENGLISQDDLGATANYIEDKYILNENDILIARSGNTVGKAYIHKSTPYDCFFAGYLIRFIVDKKKALPEYIFTFTQLNTYKDWVKAVQRPSGQPNINSEEYQSLEIPLPDIDKQHQIVDIINSAYLQKQQKESEAKQLLDSIAPYLLNELGIILPNENYGLEKRIFYISSSECVDKRIDPKKYSPKTKDLYLAIENSLYPKYSLVSFIVDSCSGDWGSDGEVDIVPSGWTKCVVLRGTEIDNMYNLSICQEKVKKRLIQTDKFKKIQPLLNDIIIEKSGGSDDQPVGRVAIVDLENFNNIPLSFSNFLMKIRVKGIDANYLYYYLKTIYNIGGTDSMQSQTNGIRNLIIKEYLEQKVVVPSLEKQQEISNHIAEMRLMAKRLQEEGESILENAKKEVEQMILG